MKLIELHILQSFPVSCLNRDDVGAPKTAVFGGCNRARISSQCLKRAIRERAKEYCCEMYRGSRTLKAAEDLAEALVRVAKWDAAKARQTADEVLNLFLSKEAQKPKKGKKRAEEAAEESAPQKTSTLLYFSPAEIDKMALAIAEAKPSKKGEVDAAAMKDAAVKALGRGVPSDAADIAIFGRMVSNTHELTLEGAGMFSHAISTHKCDNDVDFWTAVDDEKTVGEDAGAANMNVAEFTSACYYRYAALNLDLLADEFHLKTLTADGRRSVVGAFIRAALLAVPHARQNSMNAHTVPVYVLGTFKAKGHPIQLVNAFETPVWSKNGLVPASIEAMKKHYAELKSAWGVTTDVEVVIPDTNLDAFCGGLVAHVD